MGQPTPTVSAFRFAKGAETFHAGDVIFEAGSPGDCMFVIQEGEVDILIDGRVLETLGAGGVLGEMALVDGLPRSATAIARTDSKMLRVDEQHFKTLVQQHPFFALEVMRVLAHRLRQMDAALSAS